MGKYKVAIIVPIYNAEKYLKQCIESVLAQTLEGIHLILIDDGSTDHSAAIMDEYKSRGDITIIHRENRGIGETRIQGLNIAIATGEFVGWVDSDDYLDPKMFEIMYSAAVNNHSEMVYCNYEYEPHKVSGKEKWFKPYTGVVDWNLIERNTQCWNKLIKSSFAERIRLASLYEKCDEYANIALLLFAKNLLSIDQCLYHYRVGIQSISGGSYIGKIKRFSNAVGYAKNLPIFIKGTEYEHTLATYFEYRVIYTLLQLAIVASKNNNTEKWKYAKKELKNLNYKANPLTKEILDNNFGKLKSYIIRRVIPTNFYLARIITNSAIR